MMEFDLITVQLTYNNNEYTTNLTAAEVEEISSDPEKYENLCKKLQQAAEEKENENPLEGYSSQISDQPSTSKTWKWSHDATKLLLDLRLGMEQIFNNPKSKKSKYWKEIASAMKEIGGYVVTWEECHSKFRNLLQTYRNNKQKRLKKTGESQINWEFFEIFDEVLGTKASSCPSEKLLSSSVTEPITVGKSTLINSINETDTSVDLEENGETLEESVKKDFAEKIVKKAKKRQELPLSGYLYLKNEREKEKWKENKVLKEKEIAAINNLADAIRETAKSTRKRKRESSDSD